MSTDYFRCRSANILARSLKGTVVHTMFMLCFLHRMQASPCTLPCLYCLHLYSSLQLYTSLLYSPLSKSFLLPQHLKPNDNGRSLTRLPGMLPHLLVPFCRGILQCLHQRARRSVPPWHYPPCLWMGKAQAHEQSRREYPHVWGNI